MASSEAQSLFGKVALISGSSSRIGAAIARELSRRGAHVVINYPFLSEKANAEQVLAGLPGKEKSIIVEADISTAAGPTMLAEAAAAEFGKVDILVNNAGLSMLSILDTSDDADFEKTWNMVMGVNCRGTLFLTRAVLKHLSREHSRIINICSTTSCNPDPNMTIYAGSKGMIASFTRCWARDLPRKYGCTVNSVAPGPVATEAMKTAPKEFRDMLEQHFHRIPVASRMAEPEEIAWTLAMLCEEKAGWLNGLYVPVTGGSTII